MRINGSLMVYRGSVKGADTQRDHAYELLTRRITMMGECSVLMAENRSCSRDRGFDARLVHGKQPSTSC